MSSIAQIEVFPVHLRMIRSFTFASGTAGAAGGTAPHVFVKITDDAGSVGWGEGRPVPQWSYETIESVTTTIRHHLAPALIGLPVTDRWGMHRRMLRTIGRGPSTGQPIARAAIDMAVHDLCARSAGLPLRCFLGGDAARHSVPLSYTLTGHDGDSIRQEMAEARQQGFVHFNFKAAVSPRTDIEVARTVRELAGDDAFVWADANQGFALHDARRVARELAAVGVDLLEQPLPADQMHLMRQLRRDCPIALAIDESAVGPSDFFHYAAEGLVDYLVVKLTRSGGIWPTLQQLAVAESAGLPFVVSGLTDSLLTKLAACQVAAAFGNDRPAALNGSQFIDESGLFADKSQLEHDGTVYLNDRPGIGVDPDEQALRELVVAG